MAKHLVVCVLIGLAGYGSAACADVHVLDNSELAATVLPAQDGQLQPTLPQHKSNGQIGGVEAGAANVPSTTIMNGFAASAAPTPTIVSNNNNQMTISLPVPANIADIPIRNIAIQSNLGR